MRKPAKRQQPEVPPQTGVTVEAWKDDFDRRQANIAATLILMNINDTERAFLATCQKLYRQERSCETPFEEFFEGLVICVQARGLPTPADVEQSLETFRQNWESMKESSRKFLEAYPAA